MANMPPQYLQDKGYTARQDRGLIQDIYRQGVRGSTDFVVTATGAGRGLAVAAGVVYILGTKNSGQGTYRWSSDAVVNLVLDTAVTYPRVDRIVARVYDGQENNTSNDNRGTLEILKGTETNGANLDNRGNGGAQTIPFDCYLVAEVLVGTGASYTLTSTNIRDYRFLAAYSSPFFDSLQRSFSAARRDGVLDQSDASYTYNGGTSITIGGGSGWITVAGKRTLITWVSQTLSFALPPYSGGSYQYQFAVAVVTPIAGTTTGTISMVYGSLASGFNAAGLPAVPAGSLPVASIACDSSGYQSGSRSAPNSNPKSFAKISNATQVGSGSFTGAMNVPLSIEGDVEGLDVVTGSSVSTASIAIKNPGRYLLLATSDQFTNAANDIGELSIVDRSLTLAALIRDRRFSVSDGPGSSTTQFPITSSVSMVYVHPPGRPAVRLYPQNSYVTSAGSTHKNMSLTVTEI